MMKRRGWSRHAGELPPLWRLIRELTVAVPKKRNAQLFQLLRRAALQARGTKPARFYPIRAVARQCRVSPTTITHIYDRLKKEGILSGAWGSGTNVQPLHLDWGLRLRGRIALLVSLAELGAKPDYRSLALDLRGAALGAWVRSAILVLRRKSLWNTLPCRVAPELAARYCCLVTPGLRVFDRNPLLSSRQGHSRYRGRSTDR
jgi:hypothetical protein